MTRPKATLDLTVQRAPGQPDQPADQQFRRWAAAALADRNEAFELGIRLVGEAESRQLNARYRGKDRPTNVLSFEVEIPAELAAELACTPLGDLVICAPLVKREARARGIPAEDHWAHLTVHGVLHLLGHEHRAPDEAERMEALETVILADFGIADPYSD